METKSMEELLEEVKRTNAILETFLIVLQSAEVAEALDIAKDIRFLLGKATGYGVKNVRLG